MIPKQITITEENGQITFNATGFSTFEILGILRFQEKMLFIKAMNAIDTHSKKVKPKKTTK